MKVTRRGFSIRGYEFELLIIGFVLFIGSWVLSDKLNAPDIFAAVPFLVGIILIFLAVVEIFFKLSRRRY